MDFLSSTRHGNTAEAYLISTAIVVTSLFVWRWTYALLRRTLCEWAFNSQNVFDKQSLYRLSHLFTLLIPIASFYFAKRRLFFEEELSAWLTIVSVVLGQIVFLLILATFLTPLAEVILIRWVRDVPRKDHSYLQTQKQTIERIKSHVRGLIWILIVMIPALTIASKIMAVPLTMWIAPPALFFLDLAICYTILRRAKGRLPNKRSSADAENDSPYLQNFTPPDDPDLECKEQIVKFFLDIYKHQLRLLKDSPAEFRLVDPHSFAPNYIYELRAMKDGDWQARRMTIGPIGEDTGSRSKCYYVIYDHHLVIKIPPVPIHDLKEYMEILKKERRIVNRLSMKECIIPNASVILQLIQPFTRKEDFPPEKSEDDYVKLINIFSELQRYLKIDDKFVFFMDLSQYYFLGHIVRTFHDPDKNIHDEISAHADLVGDYLKFDESDSHENIPCFLEIERLYTQYTSELKNLLPQFGMPTFPPRDQIKKWFFIHLAGNRVTQVNQGSNPECIVELNNLVDRIFAEHSEAIQSYRQHLRKSINHAAFRKNKSYMEGIITNLMELLAHLQRKRVAMRDLKPDNLLVAGRRDNYPGFLAYPEEFKIGLIDVETAVILSPPGTNAIEQPPLGGTPRYASPSHFFPNSVLRRIYDDVPMILHLQDWHGIIAIIYRVVTGLPLLERAATSLTAIPRETGKYRGRELEHYHRTNRTFWNIAANEFTEKLSQHQETFRSLNVVILQGTRHMLRECAGEERSNIGGYMHHLAFHHTMPMSANDRQFLVSCSYEQTKQLRQKWESQAQAAAGRKIDRTQLVTLLHHLELLKLRLEQQTGLLALLDHASPAISAYDLLTCMFSLVMGRMNVQTGENALTVESADAIREKHGISSETTIEVTRQA
jgi:hypothetical protein